MTSKCRPAAVIASVLVCVAATPLQASALNADILSQLRRDDGSTGVRVVKATPAATPASEASSDDGTIALVSWQPPTWMRAGKDKAGFNNNGVNSGNGYASTGQSGWGSASGWEVEAVLGWDSEHIFRGSQLAKQNITGGIELSKNSAYAGVWGVLPSPDDFDNYQTRIDIYAGYGFDLGGSLYADVGATGYVRTNDGALFASEDSIEAFGGVSMDGLLHPSIYAYYDFILERYTIEAAAEYILPFGRTDLVVGGTAGYAGGAGIDYAYFQADAEIVHNLNRNTSVGVGGHFVASSEPALLDGLAITGETSHWFGVRLRAAK